MRSIPHVSIIWPSLPTGVRSCIRFAIKFLIPPRTRSDPDDDRHNKKDSYLVTDKSLGDLLDAWIGQIRILKSFTLDGLITLG